MDFIGELIKWTVLEGHNLDSDWILADIGVINVSHSGRCNLIPGVRTAVWCMSRRMAPDSVPVGESGHEPLIKACGQVLPFLALVFRAFSFPAINRAKQTIPSHVKKKGFKKKGSSARFWLWIRRGQRRSWPYFLNSRCEKQLLCNTYTHSLTS